MQGLTELLREALREMGGLATDAELAEALARMVPVEGVNAQGAVRLLMDTDPGFYRVPRLQAWASEPWAPQLAGEIGKQAERVLRAAYSPLSRAELLRRLRATSPCQGALVPMEDGFILACVRLAPGITCVGSDSFGLRRWERSYVDDIVSALRRLGRPSHYTEIARVINTASLGQAVSARAVHTGLMQHPELFVWVGRRGTYGLKEWGLERAPSYEDALAEIIGEAGHPLGLQEVLARLSTVRPYYDEDSVLLTLGTNPRFRAFADRCYGLAVWREEDLTMDFRVRRMFEASGGEPAKRPKPEVLDAMRNVDDFIARAKDRAKRGDR